MKSIKLAICVCSLSLVLSGCLANNSALRSEISGIRQSNFQMQKDLALLKDEVAKLSEKTASINGKLSSVPLEQSVDTIRTSQTNLYTQVADLLKEFQALNGSIDERLYAMNKRLKQTTADLDVMCSKLQSPEIDDAAKAIKSIEARVSAIENSISQLKTSLAALDKQPATQAESAKTPEDLYKAAYALFEAGKFPESRDAMAKFISGNPTHPYAGSAQFWIGEAFFAEKDYSGAILAYEDVISKYQTSNKIPGAMLKQAYAFQKLGKKDAAKGILLSIIDKFPKDELASKAREKLKELE